MALSSWGSKAMCGDVAPRLRLMNYPQQMRKLASLISVRSNSASAVSAASEIHTATRREPLPALDSTASTIEEKSGRAPGCKRTVALHVGYVGTEFKGLQISRQLPAEETIEGVLEHALLKCGFISPCNFGDLFKVIAFKMVMPEGDTVYDIDKEGIALSAAINKHLPKSVKVYSVQRVNKKFNARRNCLDRTYEYYLPAHVLHLSGQGNVEGAKSGREGEGSAPHQLDLEQQQKRLSLFRNALATFVGSHAFHNYTAQRRIVLDMQYKRGLLQRSSGLEESGHKSIRVTEGAGTQQQQQAVIDSSESHTLPPKLEGSGEIGNSHSDEGTAPQKQDALISPEARSKKGRVREEKDGPVNERYGGTEDSDEDEVDLYPEGEEAYLRSETKVWPQECSWVGELPKGHPDRIISQHFRTIQSWTVEDPCPLVPGGIPCLKLQVQGASFMLHQIRHMIGAAVAVAHGLISQELLEASLTPPCRMNVPRAPPHSLLLVDAGFQAFRKVGDDDATVARYTGKVLQLREEGLAARALFRSEVFDAALNQQLSHPDWTSFENNLSKFVWPMEGQRQILEQHSLWVKQKKDAMERKKEKDAREAEYLSMATDAAGFFLKIS